jgi:hypothetical protein
MKEDDEDYLIIMKKILNLNTFESAIFDEIFEVHGIVLFYDGFDEICPNYSNQVIKLIEFFKNHTNKCQQFISTRIEHGKEIHEKLQLKVYKLLPLDEENQKNFLTTFLINVKKINDELIVSALIEKCMKFVKIIRKRNTSEKSDIFQVDTPLMLSMIAEANFDEIDFENAQDDALDLINLTPLYRNYDKIFYAALKRKIENMSNIDILANFKLATLYQKFVERKFMDLPDLKGALVKEDDRNVTKSMNSVNLWEAHRFYAMNYLFDVKDYDLDILRQKPSWDVNQIYRYGFIYPGTSKINFVHRTFAEFFVATYVMKNIYECANLPNKIEGFERMRFLFHLSVTPAMNVVRNFILNLVACDASDNAMHLMFQEDHYDIFLRRMCVLLRESFFDSIVHALQFISKMFAKNKEFLKKFWFNDNDSLFLKIFKICLTSSSLINPDYELLVFEFFHDLKILLKKLFTNIDDLKEVLSGINQNGSIFWCLWSNTKRIPVHHRCHFKKDYVKKLPIDWLEEVKDLMDVEFKSNLNEGEFPYENFDLLEQTEIFRMNFNEILIHIISTPNALINCRNFFQKLKDLKMKRLNLKILLSSCRRDNIFHHFHQIEDVEVMNCIFDNCEKIFHPQTIDSALKQLNILNQMPFHEIIRSIKNAELLEVFFDYFQKYLLDDDEFRIILLTFDYKYRFMAIHNSIFNENIEVFNFVTKIYETKFSKLGMQEIFLNFKTEQVISFLGEIFSNLKAENAKIVMKYFDKLFENENEKLKDFLLVKNKYNKSFFDERMDEKNLLLRNYKMRPGEIPGIFNQLFERVFFDSQIDKCGFYTWTLYPMISSVCAASNQHLAVKIFFKNIEILCRENEPFMHDGLLVNESVENDAFMHHLDKINRVETLNFIFEKFQQLFETESLKKALKSFNSHTKLSSFLVFIKTCENLEFLECYLRFIERIFENEIEQFLTLTNDPSFTALHYSAFNKNFQIFYFTLNYYEKYLSKVEIQEIFVRNNLKTTRYFKLFLEEIFSKSPKNVEPLLEFLSRFLTSKQLLQLLFQKSGFEKKNIFQKVKNLEILKPYLNKLFEDEKIYEIENCRKFFNYFGTFAFCLDKPRDVFEKSFEILENHSQFELSINDEFHSNFFLNLTHLSDFGLFEFVLGKITTIDPQLVKIALEQKENKLFFEVANTCEKIEIFKHFVNFIRKVYTENEFKSILLERHGSSYTLLHSSAFNANFELFLYLASIYRKYFTEKELQEIFLEEIEEPFDMEMLKGTNLYCPKPRERDQFDPIIDELKDELKLKDLNFKKFKFLKNFLENIFRIKKVNNELIVKYLVELIESEEIKDFILKAWETNEKTIQEPYVRQKSSWEGEDTFNIVLGPSKDSSLILSKFNLK